MSEFKINNVATNSNAAANNLFTSSIDTINKGVQGFTSSLQGIGDNYQAEKAKKDEQSFLSFATKAANITDVAGAEMFKQQTLEAIQSNPNMFGAKSADALRLAEGIVDTVQTKDLLKYEFAAKKQTAEDGALNLKERSSLDSAQALFDQGDLDGAQKLVSGLRGTAAKVFGSEVAAQKKTAYNDRMKTKLATMAAEAENFGGVKPFFDKVDSILNDPNTSEEVKREAINMSVQLKLKDQQMSPLEQAEMEAGVKQLSSTLTPIQARVAANQVAFTKEDANVKRYENADPLSTDAYDAITAYANVTGTEADELKEGFKRIRSIADANGFSDPVTGVGRPLSVADVKAIIDGAPDDLDNGFMGMFKDTTVLEKVMKSHIANIQKSSLARATLTDKIALDNETLQSGMTEIEKYKLGYISGKSNDGSFGRTLSTNSTSPAYVQAQAGLNAILNPKKAVTAAEIIGSGQSVEQLKAGQAQYLEENPTEDISKTAVEKTEIPTAKAESVLKTEAAKPSKSLKDTRLLDILSGALSKTGEIISNRQEAFKEEQTQARVDKLFKKLATGRADASDIKRMDIDFSAYINDDQQKILDALLKK